MQKQTPFYTWDWILLQVCNKSFCFIALVNAIVKIWKYICMCYFLNLVMFFYIIKHLYIVHNSLATTAMIDLIRRFKASNKIILRATKKKIELTSEHDHCVLNSLLNISKSSQLTFIWAIHNAETKTEGVPNAKWCRVSCRM